MATTLRNAPPKTEPYNDLWRVERLMQWAVAVWGPMTIARIRAAMGVDSSSFTANSLQGKIGNRNATITGTDRRRTWWKDADSRWSFDKWESRPHTPKSASRPLPVGAETHIRAAAHAFARGRR